MLMRVPVGEIVHNLSNMALSRVVGPASGFARFQGSTGCTNEGVKALADLVLIAIDAKNAWRAGTAPAIVSPPANTNAAMACLLGLGRAAWDGTVDGVATTARGQVWTAGYVTLNTFLTSKYIWDTKLRPLTVGAAAVGYQIFFKDAGSCNATVSRYVCTSLSAYIMMQ
jgi:hypothetical protein